MSAVIILGIEHIKNDCTTQLISFSIEDISLISFSIEDISVLHVLRDILNYNVVSDLSQMVIPSSCCFVIIRCFFTYLNWHRILLYC